MTKVQKTAFLVTGSNRGYGEAISRHILSELSDSTCHVVLHARSGQVQWLESRGRYKKPIFNVNVRKSYMRQF